MRDSDGRIADYIAMTTLCRRLAVELQAQSPTRLAKVLAHATAEAEHALEAEVSRDPPKLDDALGRDRTSPAARAGAGAVGAVSS